MSREETICMPEGAHYCDLVSRVGYSGVTVDIRCYGWTSAFDGEFAPRYCYLDFALTRRAREAVMYGPDGEGPLTSGKVIFIPPGVRYATHCERSEHRSLCLSYDPARASALGEWGDEIIASLEPVLDLNEPGVESCLRQLLAEIQHPGFASDIRTELLADMAIIELARHFRGRSVGSGGNVMPPWRLRRVKERIGDGLDQPLSIAAIAHDCGVSTRHLVRTFKAAEGVTISQFVARARLERAMALLEGSDIPIAQIAIQCGFSRPSSFTAAFAKSVRQTPRAYRDARRALSVAQPGVSRMTV